VRYPFRQLPAAGGGDLTPRPVVDVWLEGIEAVPLGCLLDSGALRTRFSAELAEIAGIDLTGAPREPFAVGPVRGEAAAVRTTLKVAVGEDAHEWDASVWFCDPWPFPFQLLGLDGFFQHFRVTISAYREWVDCRPES
jgi:hypothetical protein